MDTLSNTQCQAIEEDENALRALARWDTRHKVRQARAREAEAVRRQRRYDFWRNAWTAFWLALMLSMFAAVGGSVISYMAAFAAEFHKHGHEFVRPF